MNTERPTKPGFYFVDSPDMRGGEPHVVELRENGDVYAIGVVGPIHWPPHLLQNWRKAVEAEKSRGAEDLVLEACTKLHCGGASLILNLDRLLDDVKKYDQVRARLFASRRVDGFRAHQVRQQAHGVLGVKGIGARHAPKLSNRRGRASRRPRRLEHL